MSEVWLEKEIKVAPDRYLTVRELVSSWAAHVARLADESGAEESVRVWGVDDYVAALCLRDFLARASAALDAGNAAKLATELEPIDSVFRGFTKPDPDRVALRLSGLQGRTGWWWERLPERGPVLTEVISRLGRDV